MGAGISGFHPRFYAIEWTEEERGRTFFEIFANNFAGLKKVFTFAARFGKTQGFERRKFIERLEEQSTSKYRF